MEREREIRAFKPEDFWVITADVKTKAIINSYLPVLKSREKKKRRKE